MIAAVALVVAIAVGAAGVVPVAAPAGALAGARADGRADNGDRGLAGRRVIVVPAADDALAQAEAVTAALQARGLVPVAADARAGVDGVVADVDVGDRERARTLLQEARARFRDLDVEAADRALDATLAELLRLERPEDQRELFVDALLLRAMVRMTADAAVVAGAPALRALRLAARLEPSRVELDPGLHAPRLVGAWQQARQQNAAAAAAFVVVAPRVLGVVAAPEVLVDGVLRVAEGGLLSLPEGPHLITLRALGAGSVSRIVDVVGRQTPPQNDILAPAGLAARRHAAALRVRDGDAGAFADLQALVDADVVVALSSGGRPRAWAGGDVVDVVGDPRDVAAFAAAVLRALSASGPRAPVDSPEPEPELPPWVGVVSVGLPVVVVGAVGVLVYNVFPGPEIDEPALPVKVTCCRL